MNENRDEPSDDDKEIVNASFLVGAEQFEDGKWHGVFKMEADGVAFVSQDSWDTKDEAIAWASEAGQAMLFNSLIGLVANQTSHWDD